jgi:hypothetical protein
MYHVELRDFPQNLCRFNLDERTLRAIVIPWVRQQPFELCEQRWNPAEAKITILEGPEIPLGQLKMGRGWAAAQRQGNEVTERVLGDARAAISEQTGESLAAPGSAGPALPASSPAAGAPGASLGDGFALGMKMASLLGPDALRLLEAWQDVAARAQGLTPSETLALAERSLGEGGSAD